MQARLLRSGLPSAGELLFVMNACPEEGERLAEYCRQIALRVKELESDTASQSTTRTATGDVEAARQRANELKIERRRTVVSRWMKEELEAEDRIAAMQATRQNESALKRDFYEACLKKAKQSHEQHVEEIKSRAVDKMLMWNRKAEEHEQRQKASRVQWEYRSHEQQLRYEQVVQAKHERAKEDLESKMEFLEKKSDEVVAHASRAKLLLHEKIAKARELTSREEFNANAVEETIETRRARLQRLDIIHERQVLELERARREKVERTRQSNLERARKAKEVVEAREANRVMRLKQLERSIEERSQKALQRLSERRGLSAGSASGTENVKEPSNGPLRAVTSCGDEKAMQCKKAVAESIAEKNRRLAQKWIARTLRIASAAGIPLAPPPSDQVPRMSGSMQCEMDTTAGSDAPVTYLSVMIDCDVISLPSLSLVAQQLLEESTFCSSQYVKEDEAKEEPSIQRSNTPPPVYPLRRQLTLAPGKRSGKGRFPHPKVSRSRPLAVTCPFLNLILSSASAPLPHLSLFDHVV